MAFRKILYRRSFFVALLGLSFSFTSGYAQEERPQITPGERKAPRKKDAGPRAVGVLQLAANGKASLVPIAILIDGKFWDATAYKADPIPMALESGTVYEAERAGSSLGLFTVNSALHSNAANVQSPWLGAGTWVPEGSEKPKGPLTAEKAPIGIDTTDEPPRLTRNSSQPPAQPANTTPSTPQNPPGSTGSGQTSQGPANPGQTTSKTGSDPSPPAPKPSAPTPQSGPKSGDAKSGDAKKNDAQAASGPSIAASDSGADEESRPRLRRGKPAAPFADDDIPGYSKPGTTATPVTVAKDGAPAAPDKAAVQLIPAISDATTTLPKSFAFEWLKDEEGERLKQITALAKEQVRSYIASQAKATMVPAPAPKAAGSQAARRAAPAKTTAAKIKDPILENAQMKAFDLWGNNNPVMIFTAEAHMPPPPAGTPHADSDLQYSILLVANPDIYNNLHKLFVSVTDKYHLDMAPRLELVDALDADCDGRGELLFREMTDNASGWRIYRATADKLWKMFDSLNP